MHEVCTCSSYPENNGLTSTFVFIKAIPAIVIDQWEIRTRAYWPTNWPEGVSPRLHFVTLQMATINFGFTDQHPQIFINSFSLFSPPSPPVCLQFSDNYYRADLIRALTNSLTPAISINNEVRTVDNLNSDVRLILEEITRYLNMEKLLPSFRNTITVRLREQFVCASICLTDVLQKYTSLLKKCLYNASYCCTAK